MKWIKPSKRLPKEGQQVLVYPENYPIDAMWFINYKFHEDYEGIDPYVLQIKDILYWAAIKEPKDK